MPDASCIPPNVLTLPSGGAARGAADAGTEPTRAAASATAENAAALPFIVVPRFLGGVRPRQRNASKHGLSRGGRTLAAGLCHGNWKRCVKECEVWQVAAF